jgi:precorrin-4 methylase
VREQGEELTKRGIDWQVVPGVSAFLGAAAELGVEYTVPEVSQSLIITRLEGRTRYQSVNSWSLLPATRHQWRYIFPSSVFIGWLSV